MTIMWIIIMLVVMAASVAGLVYLISRVRKFNFVNRWSKGRKWLSILVATLLVIAVAVFFYVSLGYVNMCVILITLTIFWLITDLVVAIIHKLTNKRIHIKGYVNGIIAISVSFIYLAVGMFLAYHVFITEYSIHTEKNIEPLKIVIFSDSHMGTTFDGEGFKKHIEKLNSLNPDVVLIPGDYVDGSSRYKDIITSAEAIGQIQSKYGVYFCYGNHDQNYYGEDARRDFTVNELSKLLSENGVTILEDEAVEFAKGYTVIGRKDATESDRESIASLMNKVNRDDFIIDMNHQPNDYDNEEKSGVDLVVSGHTHGGQFFPINELGVWIGANDKTYGYEKRGNTNFVVTSGISDWAVDFKTGCKSEIVVINITK